MFQRLQNDGFDIRYSFHAAAILQQDFPEAVSELVEAINDVWIPIGELVGGGGGEAQVTQRLKRALHTAGWTKGVFEVEKRINDVTTFSQSHEVDHAKQFENGKIVLEIEWNNKDPFFDRDLENFSRLHVDGAVNVGVIVTRGRSLQDGIEAVLREFAAQVGAKTFDDFAEFRVRPTQRQREMVERQMGTPGRSFAEVWAACFKSDKFGAATTHWDKLMRRLDRGLGSPCPIVAIGIPITRVTLSDRRGRA